ncbi:MAG: SycD/LcrH family type III secretion system chaperone [Simkaniaceae bacterium]|jgi:type III secretion system low calcium response chaperone LcrH/SycD
MLSFEEQEKVKKALGEVAGLMENDQPINKNYSNDDLRVLYTLAYTLYQGGDYEQAKRIFQQLASCKPLTKKYWLGLGACWQMEKSYTDALKAWGMAALIDGADPTPHYHAAECYLALEDYSEGLKAVRATKSRLTAEHRELREKVETLESSWKKEEEQGA